MPNEDNKSPKYVLESEHNQDAVAAEEAPKKEE